jgi:hypothetical protein
MMELKDFVNQTLVQLVRGVEQAQKELADSKAKINPQVEEVFGGTQTGGANQGFGWAKGGDLVSMVQFDVLVTAQEGQGTKGGVGVVAGIFALGSQGASDKANSAATRIQFGVPIILPKIN